MQSPPPLAHAVEVGLRAHDAPVPSLVPVQAATPDGPAKTQSPPSTAQAVNSALRTHVAPADASLKVQLPLDSTHPVKAALSSQAAPEASLPMQAAATPTPSVVPVQLTPVVPS